MKDYLKVSGSTEDTFIDGLVAAALDSIALHTNQPMRLDTMEYTVSPKPSDNTTYSFMVELPTNITSVTKVSVRNDLKAANDTVLDPTTYDLDVYQQPAKLYLNADNTGSVPEWLKVEWTVSEVRKELLLLTKMLVTYWYDNRDATTQIPESITAEARKYRRWNL